MCHDHLYHNTHWFFTFHPHEEFLLSFKSICRFIFLERDDEKRCLSCPGQGPASRALTLKVSPCAVLQKKAKCSDRAQDASCFTGKRKWFPGAQTQQQPLHRLSWVCSCHAQLLKCPFPTGRAMMETKSLDQTLHPCSSGPGEHLQLLTQHKEEEITGCSKGRQRQKEGFLFLSTPEMMF